jgi:hypothetical protein
LLNKNIIFVFFNFRFELHLFDHLCGDIIVEVVQNKIKGHIENTSLDNYQENFIISFEKVSTLVKKTKKPY